MMDSTTPSPPRGIRNHNPGNLRFNPEVIWRGQTGQDDDGFVIFKDALLGIRAMSLTLWHYTTILHLSDVYTIIARWAPSSDNDTAKYVDFVCSQMDVHPFQTLDLNTQGCSLVRAIIMYENGECPYSNDLIEKAIHLAHIW